MAEVWDLTKPEGRARAAAAGLYDGPVEAPQKRPGECDGQKSKKSQKRDDLAPEQVAFIAACRAHNLPEPVPEYQFDPRRKWRLDWLFEGEVALEIEGGAWTGGRHVRGRGYLSDIEKYNAAQLAGIVVLRCTPQQVEDGSIFPTIREALGL